MLKTIKIIAVSLLLTATIALSFGAGCVLGVKAPPPPSLDTVEQAWSVILQDYVDRDKLDTSKLAQGAVKGMVEALGDPHTTYLDSVTYERFLKSLKGEEKFEGIGAYPAVNKDGQIVIIAPLAGSPAKRQASEQGI